MSNLAMMMGLGSGAGGMPWLADLSAASYDNVSFSVASQETVPRDVAFKDDGTKMFLIGQTGDDVNEYALSTAWDIDPWQS